MNSTPIGTPNASTSLKIPTSTWRVTVTGMSNSAPSGSSWYTVTPGRFSAPAISGGHSDGSRMLIEGSNRSASAPSTSIVSPPSGLVNVTMSGIGGSVTGGAAVSGTASVAGGESVAGGASVARGASVPETGSSVETGSSSSGPHAAASRAPTTKRAATRPARWRVFSVVARIPSPLKSSSRVVEVADVSGGTRRRSGPVRRSRRGAVATAGSPDAHPAVRCGSRRVRPRRRSPANRPRRRAGPTHLLRSSGPLRSPAGVVWASKTGVVRWRVRPSGQLDVRLGSHLPTVSRSTA